MAEVGLRIPDRVGLHAFLLAFQCSQVEADTACHNDTLL